MLLVAILRAGETLARPRQRDVCCPATTCCACSTPGKEKELIHIFLPSERPEDVQAETGIDMLTD